MTGTQWLLLGAVLLGLAVGLYFLFFCPVECTWTPSDRGSKNTHGVPMAAQTIVMRGEGPRTLTDRMDGNEW